MRYTWTNQGSQPKKIKPFLQALGMGHRLISDIKHGQGQFLINGQTVAPTALVPSGAQLTIIVNPEPVDPAVQVNHQPITVVYEDDHWLVVDKPAGLSSIPGPTNQTDTLLNRIKGYLMEQGADDLRPHLVSRLDRFTSGLVLIAKHRVAHSMIASQVQNHEIDKRYLAIVSGQLTPDHDIIDRPIGRVADSPKRMVTTDGQAAQTEYWCEQSTAQWTLIRVRLHTGRTHQIRVHLAALDHPLLGDELYGGPQDLIARQALHATSLTFKDPFSRRTLHFESPLPADMQQILKH